MFDNSNVPLFVPAIPTGVYSEFQVCPGSITASTKSTTGGLGFLTSISMSYSAFSFPLLTTTLTFPIPSFLATFKSKFTTLSPTSLKEIDFLALPVK